MKKIATENHNNNNTIADRVENWIESLLTVEQFQAARYLTLLHTDKIRIRWSCNKKSTEPHKKNCSTELHSGGKGLLCSAPLRLEYNSYFHVNYTYTLTCTQHTV